MEQAKKAFLIVTKISNYYILMLNLRLKLKLTYAKVRAKKSQRL